MLDLKYMVTITARKYAEEYKQFFARHTNSSQSFVLCKGTATAKTLNYLGLENTLKIMFSTVVRDDQVEELSQGLLNEMNIGVDGNGIAIFIPIDGVGGKSSLKELTGDTEVINKEKTEMEEKNTNAVLIIAIVDKGYEDLVMDAAREVGAGGGTVVKAGGTGMEIAKLFGMTISQEKEMVYIVSSRANRDAIMRAIMDNAGAGTDAHGVIFSLPVDKVVGIRNLEN